MGVELRIESEAASKLADELAMLTGKSVTDVVLAALQASMERERAVQEKTKQILEIAAEIRAQFKPPYGSSDHSFLYGEDGLPI